MKKQFFLVVMTAVFAAFMASCKDDEVKVPTLTTAAVAVGDITDNSAIAGGNITDDGGSKIIERGVVYSKTPNPTVVATKKVASSAAKGSFTVELTGLEADTKYYVRAYAINSAGTAYGDEKDFTTLEEEEEEEEE